METADAVHFEVRYFEIDAAKRAAIYPFLADCLAAVGAGHVAVSDNGLQITAPISVLTNLSATIETYKSRQPSWNFDSIYGKPIFHRPNRPALAKTLEESDLCPAGIRPFEVTLTDDVAALIFTGPKILETAFAAVQQQIRDLIDGANAFMTYLPMIDFHDWTFDVGPAIAALGLCPPDMRFAYMQIKPDHGVLMFSGPKDREAFFTSTVVKEVIKLTSSINPHV